LRFADEPSAERVGLRPLRACFRRDSPATFNRIAIRCPEIAIVAGSYTARELDRTLVVTEHETDARTPQATDSLQLPRRRFRPQPAHSRQQSYCHWPIRRSTHCYFSEALDMIFGRRHFPLCAIGLRTTVRPAQKEARPCGGSIHGCGLRRPGPGAASPRSSPSPLRACLRPARNSSWPRGGHRFSGVHLVGTGRRQIHL
jgi:hypothetical protein